ncbi:hypothetical protein N864_15605 [Intrasporangium chromatireducens Q5-1]|uniref:Mercury transporter n=1 Tax=Intrasporangium chromatireducens Q5-1 TaxID=584657 RepID=W9GDJ7_9MICO|nr:hypothetical protein [Intrasporangium chromatireducens]EWT04135.1 hypothetical protein N864_15605 [Intrasporangium chromatireducens Q5-1]
MTSNRDNQPGGGGLLMAAGAGLLMVACCALPALIAGGVLAGIGGFLRNPWVIGAGIALLGLAVLTTTRRHHGPGGSEDCCPPSSPGTRTDHSTTTKDIHHR